MSIDQEVAREFERTKQDSERVYTIFEKRLDVIEDVQSEQEKRQNAIESKLATKISWPWFITTGIVIAGMNLTILLYINDQIRSIQADIQEAKVGLSQLNGKLEPFDFTQVK